MKNIILLFLLFSTNVLADKITKDGFLTSKAGYLKDQNINNPENKIILIYNHGQKSHDGPSSDCAWKSGMQNISSLVGKKINDKQVYNLNDRIVIGLLHDGRSCNKDEIDYVKSHQVTGRYCELRNNTPLENLDAGMGDIFIKLAR